MATYTIITSRKQQVGLQFSYDTYADKTIYTTIDAWLQFKVSSQVTTPMYDDQQQAQSVSFDQSFKTVPDASQPKAKADVEAAIIANGGTIVPAGPVGLPPPTGNIGGAILATRGEASYPIQAGAADKEPPDSK